MDAIIIGSGLAGLSTALTILDAGGSVTVLEKEAKMGGNSMKASSGINACPSPEDRASFLEDTLKSSSGNGSNHNGSNNSKNQLIQTLVENSSDAVLGWLQKRLDLDLSQVAQLGGHSQARTHRPGGKLPIGAEIMIKLQQAVQSYQEKGTVQILTNSKVTKLLQEEDKVVGVAYETTNEGDKVTNEIQAKYGVVLATGGFAADRSEGSWLSKYRPEYLKLGATAGEFSTGDGLSLATSLSKHKAGLIDMDQVQVHPTGFIDPKDPDNPNKFLAAEVLRGVGAILLNKEGKRFCNEIGRRDYVTDKVLSLDTKSSYATTKQWNVDDDIPRVFLLLSEEGAATIQKHIDFYAWKGFLVNVTGMEGIAEYTGVSKETIQSTLQSYAEAASKGKDDFDKTRFLHVPKLEESTKYYVGKVTPVLHYCMGGLTIDVRGQVLDENGTIIPGLHACGEVSGGVHGANRLAGNSLCECVVFGHIVGQKIISSRL